jgi:hypothetical protein
MPTCDRRWGAASWLVGDVAAEVLAASPSLGVGLRYVVQPLRWTAASELDHPSLPKCGVAEDGTTSCPFSVPLSFPLYQGALFRAPSVAGGASCVLFPLLQHGCTVPSATLPAFGGLEDGISDAHPYTLERSPRSRGCPESNDVEASRWLSIIVVTVITKSTSGLEVSCNPSVLIRACVAVVNLCCWYQLVDHVGR